jgi:hypothetical protein
MKDEGTPPLLDEEGGLVEPLTSPAISPEKPPIRKLLAKLMTFLVIGLFICVAAQYLWRDSEADRSDFVHLFELILVLYGTILGFYFGSQD